MSVQVGSHVTFSVGSEGVRNYWPEAAIRSNRFRLFQGARGHLPEPKGQAKAFFSMKFLRKSSENESLIERTDPRYEFGCTRTAKRTVADMLNLRLNVWRFDAPT